MKKTRGLGRGFESLIPVELVDEEFDPTAPEDKKESTLIEIELSEIVRDETQPRKDFDSDSLEALAKSIKEHGVLQPIVVTKEEDHYRLVAGERRWRASKLAGLTKIPAIVRSLDAQNRLELSIIENAQREDLNAIELATAYAKLKAQFNLSDEEIAARVGKGRTSISNTLRLLNLPDSAKKAMVEYKLSEGVMRPLVSLPPKMIEKAVPRIIEEGWSARQSERFVLINKKKSSTNAVKESLFQKEEKALAKKYNAKFRIRARTLTITCKNEKELKELIANLRGGRG